MVLNNTIAILAVLLIMIGITVQGFAYMNLDNAWLLHVAESLVSGQKLHVDVVETNPPLIVYLMAIPIYIAKLLGIGNISGFIIFISLLSVASLSLSFRMLTDARIKLLLVFVLLFMPTYNFGEREHIFVILLMPYFISLWQTEKRSVGFNIVLAVMAGIAFCLKPFFLLIWAALLITKMVLDKRFFAFLTLQNIIIGAIVVAYPLYLIFIEKTYINEVLPLLVKYYGSYSSRGEALFKQSFAMAFLGQVSFWVLFIKNRAVLTRPIYFSNFANIAAIGVMVVQGKIWSNYFYPPDVFAFITNALIFLALFDGDLKPLWNKVIAIITSFLLVVYLTMAIAISIKIGFGIKEEYEDKLVEVLKTNASGRNVMSLNFDLGAAFPAVMHSPAVYTSRYGCLWMLPGMYADQKADNKKLKYREPKEKGPDEAMISKQVIEDFNKSKPELVVVVKGDYYSPGIGEYGFDFIEYFSKEPEFAEIWKNYELLMVIGEEKDKYQKEVYKLKD